jgi:Fe-S-cluster-containing hydrogenase component 2
MIRKIVKIDEEKCDGCGLCVPACHEGALRIIDGKARLVGENLCDGLGDCLGECPQGAIEIIEREAAAFDEAAVDAHAAHARSAEPATVARRDFAGGCPGSRLLQHDRTRAPGPTAAEQASSASVPSELTHWPVQLHLVPPTAPWLKGARFLVCADCVAYAVGEFHRRFLRDRTLVIACPKLDDTSGYLEKLTAMIRENDLVDVTVARMEVPCCGGISQAVAEARRRSGRDVPLHEMIVTVRGEIALEREIPATAVA